MPALFSYDDEPEIEAPKPKPSSGNGLFTYDEEEAPAAKPKKPGVVSQVLDTVHRVTTPLRVPGAAVRSAIRGQGYAQGATDPDAVQSFQSEWLDKFYQGVDTSKESGVPSFLPPPVQAAMKPRETMGAAVSTMGLMADVATDPVALLTLIAGKAPVGRGLNLETAITQSRAGQALGKVLNYPIGKKPAALPTEADIQAAFSSRRGQEAQKAESFNISQIDDAERELLQTAKSAAETNADLMKSKAESSTKQFYSQGRDAVLRSREKAIPEFRKGYEYYGNELSKLRRQQWFEPEEAYNFLEEIRSRLGFGKEGRQTVLSGAENKINKLQQRFQPDTIKSPLLDSSGNPLVGSYSKFSDEPVLLDRLLDELGALKRTSYKSGPFTEQDHLYHVVDDVVGDLLERRGVEGIGPLKAWYRREFAPVRNTTFKLFDPYAKGGQYDTDSGVKFLDDIVSGKSSPKSPDDAAFFEAYTQKIDPELKGLVEIERAKRAALTNEEKFYTSRYENAVRRSKAKAEEARYNTMRTTASQMNDLIDQASKAKTMQEKQAAQDKLIKLVKGAVWGVGLWEGGKKVIKTFLPS